MEKLQAEVQNEPDLRSAIDFVNEYNQHSEKLVNAIYAAQVGWHMNSLHYGSHQHSAATVHPCGRAVSAPLMMSSHRT